MDARTDGATAPVRRSRANCLTANCPCARVWPFLLVNPNLSRPILLARGSQACENPIMVTVLGLIGEWNGQGCLDGSDDGAVSGSVREGVGCGRAGAGRAMDWGQRGRVSGCVFC